MSDSGLSGLPVRRAKLIVSDIGIGAGARFDFGFMTNEFARIGLDYGAFTLCAVRLSRRLYPGQRRHNLDALISRHGLVCRERHRAMRDAKALLQFLRSAREECGQAAIADALRRIVSKSAPQPPDAPKSAEHA